LELLFVELFHSYEKPLYMLALKMTKNAALSKDIVQDVYIRLWEIRHQLHEVDNIERFLFRLTRNKVIDFLRVVAADDRLKQAIWDTMQQMVTEPTDAMEQKEYHQVIAKAIDLLPEKRRAVYQLRNNGLDYQEIAEELHISRHTVKHQLSAAFKFIRSYFHLHNK